MEVVTNTFIGTVKGVENHHDYWIVTGHAIPVYGFNGVGMVQDWAYVRDPHLMPIDPDADPLPYKELEIDPETKKLPEHETA